MEWYDGIIRKAISLALKSKGLPVNKWEKVLLDALHLIRSLLCTATNATPHERFFTFQRRSANGEAILTWLSEPVKIFVKRHVRNSKFEPLVEEAGLEHKICKWS